MSHIATIQTQIKDIEAVKRACAELGLEFKEGQTTCAFWPTQGQPQLHPCTHAVALPVGSYKMELGLVRNEDGSYALVGDNMLHHDDGPTCRMLFGRDTNPLGTKFNRLLQLYGVHKTTIEAQKKGWMVRRTQVGPKVQLTVTGM